MQRARSVHGLGLAAFVDGHSASPTNGRTGVFCLTRSRHSFSANVRFAPIVQESFLGRTTDAFERRDVGDPHRFTQKRPPTFVSALRRVAAVETAQNQFFARFSSSSDFRLFATLIRQEPTFKPNRERPLRATQGRWVNSSIYPHPAIVRQVPPAYPVKTYMLLRRQF